MLTTMQNDTPRAPGGKTVHINSATALLIERLQAHHLAIFGSKPSRPAIIQRAVEAFYLKSRETMAGRLDAGPPEVP